MYISTVQNKNYKRVARGEIRTTFDEALNDHTRNIYAYAHTEPRCVIIANQKMEHQFNAKPGSIMYRDEYAGFIEVKPKEGHKCIIGNKTFEVFKISLEPILL